MRGGPAEVPVSSDRVSPTCAWTNYILHNTAEALLEQADPVVRASGREESKKAVLTYEHALWPPPFPGDGEGLKSTLDTLKLSCMLEQVFCAL
jgi:hypothetical protein